MPADLLAPALGVLITQPPGHGVLADIAGAIAPGNLLFVNGWLDPDRRSHSDVRLQTLGALQSLQAFLESHDLTLSDAALMHAYIGSDAARDGYAAGYADFFGPHQRHKPAHSLLHVVRPGASDALVEIDLVAVRPTPPAHD